MIPTLKQAKIMFDCGLMSSIEYKRIALKHKAWAESHRNDCIDKRKGYNHKADNASVETVQAYRDRRAMHFLGEALNVS